MAFEKRTDNYFHFTSWRADDLKEGQLTATLWEETHYWNFQGGNNEEQIQQMARDFEAVAIQSGAKFSKPAVTAMARNKAKAQRMKEEQLERIRATEFPDLPSRRNCIFLCESEGQMRQFITEFGFPTKDKRIIELRTILFKEELNRQELAGFGITKEQFQELNKCNRHRANPKFLNSNIPGPEQQNKMRRYWRGDHTGEDELTEVLYYGFMQLDRIVEDFG
jgi:hypothetical protein